LSGTREDYRQSLPERGGEMTFEEYWERKGHFGSDPEEVARLAWYAALETGAELLRAAIPRGYVQIQVLESDFKDDD
jgi:hypothetical protein